MVSVRFLSPLAVFPFGVILHGILNGFPSFGVSLFSMDFLSVVCFCSCVESSACVYSVFRVGAVFIFVQCLHGCSEMQVNVHEVSFARDLLIFRSSFVSRVLFLASSWFYAAGVFAGIRCGSPRGCICSGYPLASICCGCLRGYTLPASSCVYVAGIFVHARLFRVVGGFSSFLWFVHGVFKVPLSYRFQAGCFNVF